MFKGTSSDTSTVERPNCYCDSTCDTFQDCCLDYMTHCASTALRKGGSCVAAGACDASPVGHANSCYCDAGCEDAGRRDCCSDYNVCKPGFPQIRLETRPPLRPAPALPPVCRDSNTCSTGFPLDFSGTLQFGACETYGADGSNEGFCADTGVISLCTHTCRMDDRDWNGGFGKCATYGYDQCDTPGGACNYLHCDDHGATEFCPLACGVCRPEIVSDTARAAHAARSSGSGQRPRSPQRVGRATRGSRGRSRGH